MNHDDAILVGSRATKYWFSRSRDPNDDYDFFIDSDALDYWKLRHGDQYISSTRIGDDNIQFRMKIGTTLGFDNSRYQSVRMFLDINKDMPKMEAFGLKFRVASPESLLAIKKSHIYHRHNWFKHIDDYSFLKSQGLCLTHEIIAAMDERIRERDQRGDFKIPASLDVSNEKFFSESDKTVKRKFKHDDLHKAVMYYDEPIYDKIKHDKSKAMVEKELFDGLSYDDKCNLVREEAYVIGLERIIIPQWYNYSLLRSYGLSDEPLEISSKTIMNAYKYAIMRLSTDLTKGWFREFVAENYIELKEPDVDYVDKFLRAYNNGNIGRI